MNKALKTTAIALLAVAPMALLAQRGQGGPPQGGPGMMQRGPGMMAGPAILFRQDVQTELKLTQSQIEKLREIVPGPGGPRGEFGGSGGPPRGQQGQGGQRQRGQGDFQGGPPQGGRPGQNAEETAKIDAAVKGVLNDAQFKRYHELDLQLAGPMAILRTDVSEKLKITDEQREKIMEVLRPQDGPGFGGPPQGGRQRQQGGPPQGFDPEQMEQRRKEQNEKILAVLTDSQLKQWLSMLGKEFKFERIGPPPGGPGGGGAPGVRGGGN